MSILGQLTAKPPVSPHANLKMIERTGTTNSGSAIWSIACACGVALSATAPRIKSGAARCEFCNPRHGTQLAAKIRAVLPATYSKIERKTKLTQGQVNYHITCMRERGECHIGGWERADYQGSFNPIFFAGPGEDISCPFKPRTRSFSEKRYKRRVKRAIEQAAAGGKEDLRYSRHITLYKIESAVRQARKTPQTWLSALMPPIAGQSRLQSAKPR